MREHLTILCLEMTMQSIKKISFILVIVISVIYVVFDDGSSSFDENPVTNSGLDASVYQVEQFLDDNLNDPDSSMTP